MEITKIILLDTYYQDFLNSLPFDDETSSFKDYEKLILDYRFGTGTALSLEFQKLGWNSQLIVPNFLEMQSSWRLENGFVEPLKGGWNRGAYLARLPIANRLLEFLPHLHQTLLNQIRNEKPDVVYVQDLNIITPSVARKIKSTGAKLVGEIASPLPPKSFLREYDLIVSALIPLVQELRSLGVKSEWNPLGFDIESWNRLKNNKIERTIDVVFIGSITKLQKTTIPLIKSISKFVDNFKVYGPISTKVGLENAKLSHVYAGEAWGNQMFEILLKSKITINRHGEIAKGYATNMRMFEATGMGSLLVTDAQKNLDSLFTVGKEVLAYTNPLEASQIIEQILKDETELKRIANQGQLRTHSEHTYKQRTERLSELIRLL